MYYKTRPGVVLTTVCGENLLVAAKAAAAECPYVTQINDTSAFLWERLVGGNDVEGLMAAVAEEYEVAEPDMIRSAIESFIKEMTECGYLLVSEQGGNNDE